MPKIRFWIICAICKHHDTPSLALKETVGKQGQAIWLYLRSSWMQWVSFDEFPYPTTNTWRERVEILSIFWMNWSKSARLGAADSDLHNDLILRKNRFDLESQNSETILSQELRHVALIFFWLCPSPNKNQSRKGFNLLYDKELGGAVVVIPEDWPRDPEFESPITNNLLH